MGTRMMRSAKTCLVLAGGHSSDFRLSPHLSLEPLSTRSRSLQHFPGKTEALANGDTPLPPPEMASMVSFLLFSDMLALK